MSAHTAGPWYLVREGRDLSIQADADNGTVYHIAENIGGRVRKDADGKYTDRSEVYANAALLLAAPDLLAALQAAMAFIDSHAGDPDLTEEMCHTYAALQSANPRAAIAKALQSPERLLTGRVENG